MAQNLTLTDLQNQADLLETIQYFSLKGWTPATSSNFSLRLSTPDRFFISRSGVDKSRFQKSDLLTIDSKSQIIHHESDGVVKTSAETLLHLALYERYPQVQCVLHTHSTLGAWLGNKNLPQRELKFSGWEILKGLQGVATHLTTVTLPIVANHQDMVDILKEMEGQWDKKPHGFLVAGHGLYTWGASVAEAKRHVETFEILFQLHHLGA